MSKVVKYLIYIFVFFIPLQTRKILLDPAVSFGTWEWGRVSLYGSEILLWLIIMLSVYSFWRCEEKLRVQSLKFKVFGIISVLFIAISILFSTNALLTIVAWLKLIEVIALLFILRKATKIRPATSPQLLIAILSSAFLQSLLAFQQAITQHIPANKWLGLAEHLPSTPGVQVVAVNGVRFLRAYGLFPHPNMLAAWLLLGILALWYLYSSSSRPLQWKRIASFAFLATVLVVALGLTFSRVAWVMFILCVIVVSIIAWLKKQPASFPIILASNYSLIVLLVFFLAAWPLVSARTQVQSSLEQRSLTEHASGIKEAAKIFIDHPLTGVGFGAYTAYLQRDGWIGSTWPQPVHNIIFLAAAETGIVGLAAILYLYYFVLKKTWQKIRNGSVLNLPLVLIPVSLLFLGLSDHFLLSSWSGLMMGALAVILL